VPTEESPPPAPTIKSAPYIELIALPQSISGSYQGEWNNENRPHGKGVFLMNSGYQYHGSWHNGRRHGHGTSFFNGRFIVEKWNYGMLEELIQKLTTLLKQLLPHPLSQLYHKILLLIFHPLLRRKILNLYLSV
jgi:hypothetical protein